MGAPTKLTWTNETRKLSQLVPWPKNPRRINAKERKRLQDSWQEFGQPDVIAIDPKNGVLNGHQRLSSWLEAHGDIEVAVRVASRMLTEKEREKLTVILHRGATGDWDFQALVDGFQMPDLLEWGFNADEFAEWIAKPEPLAPDDFSEYDDDIETEYCCPKCGYEWSGKPK